MAAAEVKNLMTGFLNKFSTSLADLDYFNKPIEFDDDPNNVATGENIIVLSGPPVLQLSYTDASKSNAKDKSIVSFLSLMGAVQALTINTGKQVIPFRELGSKITRQVSGPTQYSGSIASVLTKTNNLKYKLYKWLFKAYPDGINFVRTPGGLGKFAKHFVGLESDLYAIPFGLLVMVGAASGEIIQSQYLEKCHVINEGTSYQAGQALIADNLSFSIGRSVPIHTVAGNNPNSVIYPVFTEEQLKGSDYSTSKQLYKPTDPV